MKTDYTIEDFKPAKVHNVPDYDKAFYVIDGLWEVEQVLDMDDETVKVMLTRKDFHEGK